MMSDRRRRLLWLALREDASSQVCLILACDGNAHMFRWHRYHTARADAFATAASRV
jgi:hypothetical protein